MDFRVRGTEAGAQFDIGDTNLHILESGTAGCDHYADVDLTGDATVTGHAEQDREFLEAVAAGATPETNTVEEALTVQRVIDAIYRSNEAGRAIRPADARVSEAQLERATRLD
jgi:predicted dehydrogenase